MPDMTVGTHDAQLARMQRLASEEWSWSSRWHPGELAWFWWEAGGPADDWHLATWQQDGRTVAWAWSRLPGRLDLQVAPSHHHVVDDVLAWFDTFTNGSGTHESGTNRAEQAVTVLDGEATLIAALADHGFTPGTDEAFIAHLRMDLTDLGPVRPLPPGMNLRPLSGPLDADERSRAHRDVFGSLGDPEASSATYRRLMSDSLYHADLDWIVEDADGTVFAFCLSWVDEQSSVAVLEPVGTRAPHRRQGLAIATVTASLTAARACGAHQARVCARDDSRTPEALATYERVGFRRYARNIRLTRRRT